jgi:serine/threonine-protein kinase RsbW
MQDIEEIKIRNDISEIPSVAEKVEELIESLGLSPTIVFNIQLALEELLTNIISYGYNDDSQHEILIRFQLNDDYIEITLEDDGIEFNPLLKEDPDLNQSIEERKIGGLGIYFVKQFMDDIKYQRKENKNILQIKKRIN